MKIRLILIAGLSFLLFACTSSNTVVTGSVAEPLDFNDVQVFYTNPPDCNFMVIAYIKIPGEYYSRSALIDGFRQKAAAVGAPAVQITFIQQTGSTEFFGSARAIRCE